MIDLNDMFNGIASDINNSFQQLQHRQTQTFGGLIGKFEQRMSASLSAIETAFSSTECDSVSTGN
jgi:hypothetical protein